MAMMKGVDPTELIICSTTGTVCLHARDSNTTMDQCQTETCSVVHAHETHMVTYDD